MKPNKSQRHKYYKEALVKLRDKNRKGANGLCIILGYIMEPKEYHLPIYYQNVIDSFPELLAKRPKHITYRGSVWFPEADKESRIAILKSCIKQTAPKKRKPIK